MVNKTSQLQIRVSPSDKARLHRLARQAGQDLSSYVLSKVLPDDRERITRQIDALKIDAERSYALAELHDWLMSASAPEFVSISEGLDVSALEPLWQNYVAALIEQAADRKAVPPPAWVARVRPLEQPWFAVPFASLRLHLIKSAPVPFKRRNIFVDTGLGSRV
ncbi:MAG: hypothetical protein WD081_07055 [Gammaproteobacteria bacterium]